jgi:hypothetical protein
MNRENDASIKDKILRELAVSEEFKTIEEISDSIKEEFDAVYTLSDDLDKDDHISQKEISTKNKGLEKLVKINPQGKYFLKKYGYKNQYSEEVRIQALEEKIKKLTIKELEGNIFQLKYWWIFLLISLIAGFVSANFRWVLDSINKL